VIDALLNASAVLKGCSAPPKAAGQGRTDVVAYLLDRGAAINEVPDEPDILDNTAELGVKNALCATAWRGQSAVVKLLLERGADASVKDTNSRSSFELAEIEGPESCINVLSRYARSTLREIIMPRTRSRRLCKYKIQLEHSTKPGDYGEFRLSRKFRAIEHNGIIQQLY
jgi:hypothetical protein